MKYEVGLNEQEIAKYQASFAKDGKGTKTSGGYFYITDTRVVFAEQPLWFTLLCVLTLVLIPLLIIIKPKNITSEIQLKDIIKISLEKDGSFNRYTLYTKDDEFQYQFTKNSEQEILNYLKSGIEKATGKKVSATSDIIDFI
jgi:hypothetical protein